MKKTNEHLHDQSHGGLEEAKFVFKVDRVLQV